MDLGALVVLFIFVDGPLTCFCDEVFFSLFLSVSSGTQGVEGFSIRRRRATVKIVVLWVV